jgi:hypothetical protein
MALLAGVMTLGRIISIEHILELEPLRVIKHFYRSGAATPSRWKPSSANRGSHRQYPPTFGGNQQWGPSHSASWRSGLRERWVFTRHSTHLATASEAA